MALFKLWFMLIAAFWMVGGLRQVIRREVTFRYYFFFWGGSRQITGPAVVVWGVGVFLLGVIVEILSALTLLTSTGDDTETVNVLWIGTFRLVSAYMLIMLPFTLAVHYVTHDQMKTKSKRKPKIKNDGIYEDAN
jgi:hypothetical protein